MPLDPDSPLRRGRGPRNLEQLVGTQKHETLISTPMPGISPGEGHPFLPCVLSPNPLPAALCPTGTERRDSNRLLAL